MKRGDHACGVADVGGEHLREDAFERPVGRSGRTTSTLTDAMLRPRKLRSRACRLARAKSLPGRHRRTANDAPCGIGYGSSRRPELALDGGEKLRVRQGDVQLVHDSSSAPRGGRNWVLLGEDGADPVVGKLLVADADRLRPRSASKARSPSTWSAREALSGCEPPTAAAARCAGVLDQGDGLSCRSNCRPRAGDSRGSPVWRPSDYGLLPTRSTSSARHASPNAPVWSSSDV